MLADQGTHFPTALIELPTGRNCDKKAALLKGCSNLTHPIDLSLTEADMEEIEILAGVSSQRNI
jgi:hypothetical protein